MIRDFGERINLLILQAQQPQLGLGLFLTADRWVHSSTLVGDAGIDFKILVTSFLTRFGGKFFFVTLDFQCFAAIPINNCEQNYLAYDITAAVQQAHAEHLLERAVIFNSA